MPLYDLRIQVEAPDIHVASDLLAAAAHVTGRPLLAHASEVTGSSNLTPLPRSLCQATPPTGYGRPVVSCNRDSGHRERRHRGTLPNGQVYLW